MAAELTPYHLTLTSTSTSTSLPRPHIRQRPPETMTILLAPPMHQICTLNRTSLPLLGLHSLCCALTLCLPPRSNSLLMTLTLTLFLPISFHFYSFSFFFIFITFFYHLIFLFFFHLWEGGAKPSMGKKGERPPATTGSYLREHKTVKLQTSFTTSVTNKYVEILLLHKFLLYNIPQNITDPIMFHANKNRLP